VGPVELRWKALAEAAVDIAEEGAGMRPMEEALRALKGVILPSPRNAVNDWIFTSLKYLSQAYQAGHAARRVQLRIALGAVGRECLATLVDGQGPPPKRAAVALVPPANNDAAGETLAPNDWRNRKDVCGGG